MSYIKKEQIHDVVLEATIVKFRRSKTQTKRTPALSKDLESLSNSILSRLEASNSCGSHSKTSSIKKHRE